MCYFEQLQSQQQLLLPLLPAGVNGAAFKSIPVIEAIQLSENGIEQSTSSVSLLCNTGRHTVLQLQHDARRSTRTNLIVHQKNNINEFILAKQARLPCIPFLHI